MENVTEKVELTINNNEVEPQNVRGAAGATATPGTTDILALIQSKTKERKSVELKGTIKSIQFFPQTEKQKTFKIVNGVCELKTEGGEVLKSLRFTANEDQVGSFTDPKINEGDDATFSVLATQNDYGYSGRLVTTRKAMSLAQHQQMEKIKQLGIPLNIAVA